MQLDPGQDGVGAQRHQERVVRVVPVVAAAPEGHREVEPEPVDVALADPVAQRVQDHPADHGVAQVQGVAAAGDVDVLAALVEPVVGAVVQTAPGQRRAVAALLGGVVVDDVEDDLQALAVQRLDHVLELVQHRLRAGRGGVRRVRGEEAEGVVAPVVDQAPLDQGRLGGEGLHRQQLDGGDAEVPQVLRWRRGAPGRRRCRAAARARPGAGGSGCARASRRSASRSTAPGGARRPPSRSRRPRRRSGACTARCHDRRARRDRRAAGRPTQCPYTSGRQVTSPSTALAYGSSTQLVVVVPQPLDGRHGPCTRRA